jgi:DNA-binding transcriptional LysR family regulator
MKTNVLYLGHNDLKSILERKALQVRPMTRDLDLALLRAFTAVVDAGSVTGAARILNRTQAAVSLQIKRLEEALGQTLFERHHKRLVLAPAGEELLGFAQRLVAMNDEVWDRMTTPVFEGEVRLGVPVDLIPAYVPPILRRFNSTWPRVQVSLIAKNSADLLEDMNRGEVDLSLTTDELDDRRGERLKTDKLVWVGAPGGTAHRATPLPVSLGGKNCRFRPIAIDALRKSGRDWRVVLQVANQDAVNATVAAGLCVSLLLEETVPHGLEALNGAAGLPELPKFAINLHLPKAGGNANAEELARHIRAEFAARSALKGELVSPSTRLRSDGSRRKPAAALAVSNSVALRRRLP